MCREPPEEITRDRVFVDGIGWVIIVPDSWEGKSVLIKLYDEIWDKDKDIVALRKSRVNKTVIYPPPEAISRGPYKLSLISE